MKHWLVSLVFVAACTKVGTGQESPPAEPTTGVSPIAPPAKTVPQSPKATVELTAVTLADDCGGAPPSLPPMKTATKERAAKGDDDGSKAKAKRRCEQTSMQLSINATDASRIQVKSVELFDEKGASLGVLAVSKPTRWSDANASYEAWDEKFDAGSTSVSYVLQQPNWDAVADRWNKTYTLKAIVSIGGADQSTSFEVTISAPTTLPPNVKT